MWLKLFSLITLCMVLSSCSANTWVYDKDGNVMYHVKTDGKAIHKLKVPEFEVETDGKTEPLFNLDLNGLKGGD